MRTLWRQPYRIWTLLSIMTIYNCKHTVWYGQHPTSVECFNQWCSNMKISCFHLQMHAAQCQADLQDQASNYSSPGLPTLPCPKRCPMLCPVPRWIVSVKHMFDSMTWWLYRWPRCVLPAWISGMHTRSYRWPQVMSVPDCIHTVPSSRLRRMGKG